MFAIALAALLASLAATGDARLQLNGRCEYSAEVQEHRDGTVLALCDTLEIVRDGNTGTLDFRQRSWGSTIRFQGEMAGDRMIVRSVRPRAGETAPATGTCEVFHANDRISVVACLARAGTRSYAANFVVSRL
ncbi:hypothetical protein [Novosphingobium album (ex Liu et al. 2023)]|uniref:Elongation factor P n=1 Tax=Novosphingobium album (ex Liu et al. 2023) TaxID=3031130 RepID=A0ABT5WV87_9SPHN|nr:hypothetical protein [Novosphingobium album (ex Liu et al. 2023)]MDE8653768.1 hypothetical protein [Novosphingobium album (ex Liu et al. 2023)]